MSEIRTLIIAAGGQRKAARLIGVPIGTLHAWAANNRVPHWRADKEDELRRLVADLRAGVR